MQICSQLKKEFVKSDLDSIRAQIFQIFKKVGVKLYQNFHQLNDFKGTLGNLL